MALLAFQYQHQEQQLSEKINILNVIFLEYEVKQPTTIGGLSTKFASLRIRLSHSDLQLL